MSGKHDIVDEVRSKYASIAASSLSSNHEGVAAIAQAFGYTADELASLPAEANMGLSCGNPIATANLRPGETVVDLGSGGGIDVLLASRKVGPQGRAIGIDMTDEMLERARKNAVQFGNGVAPENVEFRKGRLESLPLEDSSVDCLISNCVINLAPDKQSVLKEMYRVLRPGGRVAVSDIALKQPLPEEIRDSINAYVGCVAGAILIDDYEKMLREAGFDAVQVVDTCKDLNVYGKLSAGAACCNPSPEALMPKTELLSADNECCSSTNAEPAGPTGASCCSTSKVEAKAPGASGCCSTEQEAAKTPAATTCCVPTSSDQAESGDVLGLAEILSRYDINDYAASVQVYALKR